MKMKCYRNTQKVKHPCRLSHRSGPFSPIKMAIKMTEARENVLTIQAIWYIQYTSPGVHTHFTVVRAEEKMEPLQYNRCLQFHTSGGRFGSAKENNIVGPAGGWLFHAGLPLHTLSEDMYVSVVSHTPAPLLFLRRLQASDGAGIRGISLSETDQSENLAVHGRVFPSVQLRLRRRSGKYLQKGGFSWNDGKRPTMNDLYCSLNNKQK